MSAPALSELEGRLLRAAEPGTFGGAELDGLPAPVRRHLTAAIAPGTPLAVGARLRMRGRIKVGRWLPFRAREVLGPAPRVRVGRAGRRGHRRVRPVRRRRRRHGLEAGRPGHRPARRRPRPRPQRRGAGRRRGDLGADRAAPAVRGALVGQRDRRGERQLPDRGRPRRAPLPAGRRRPHLSFTFDRWGDPDGTGIFAWHPFGGEITGCRSFDGVTIPSAGRVGWFFGTDRWPGGEFFRYQITDLRLVGAAPPRTKRLTGG